MKGIKSDIKRQKDIPLSWIDKINIVKMITTYKFNAIPVKLAMTFSQNQNNIFIIYVRTKNTLNSQINVDKEKQI